METTIDKKAEKKEKSPVWIVLSIFLAIGILIGYIFLSGLLVLNPLGKDVILTGKNVVVDDMNPATYTIHGDVVKKGNYLLWKYYEVKISELYIGKEYNITVPVPFWVSELNEMKSGMCANFSVSYRELLPFLHVLSGTEFVSSCDTVPGSADELDTKKLQEDAFAMVSSFYREETDEFPIALDCSESGCEGTYVEGPNAWYRYAQFYNDRSNNSVNYSTYLEDLETYPGEDFDWRLFQYGNIVASSEDSASQYSGAYIAALESVIPEGYFDPERKIEEKNYMYMIGNEPSEQVERMFDYNYGELDSGDIDLTVGKLAYDAIALAHAYELTSNEKYLYALDHKLSDGHSMMYFQDNVVSPKPVEFKTSSCNMILADVNAYKVTGEEFYLEYLDHVVAEELIDYIYGEVSISETEGQTHSPMTYLPCMSAFEILIELEEGDLQAYNNYQKLILNYILDYDLINLDPEKETYGSLQIGDATLDEVGADSAMSSTCWFVKILSMINSRGGL